MRDYEPIEEGCPEGCGDTVQCDGGPDDASVCSECGWSE